MAYAFLKDDWKDEGPLEGFGTPAGQNAQRKQVKPKKQKDFWTDQISTGLGIAGGIGGGILGTFAAPVAGTAAGAVAGSAGGSALGEFLENAITGERDKSKNVVQEGVLGGVFALPPLKAAKVGMSLAKGGGRAGAEQALIGGAKQQATRGLTERTGQNLIGDAWGIRSGVKLFGKPVTPQKANELQKFVTGTVGVPKTANADQVFERVVNLQNDTGTAIKSAIKSSTLDPKNIDGLTSTLSGKFSKVIGANAADNPIALDILTQVKTAKSPSELWDVRRRIDDTLINFGRNPQAGAPGTEQLARIARTEINNTLNKSAPGIAGLNKTYSRASDVAELVAGASKTPMGIKLPGFLGSVGGRTIQSGRAALGQGLDSIRGGASEGLNITKGAPTVNKQLGLTIPRLGARQAIGQNLFGNPGSKAPSLDEALMQQQGEFDPNAVDPNAYDPNAEAEVPAEQSPYTRENMMADIQRDPENADKYIEYFASLDEIFNPVTKEPKALSTAAAKDISNAQTGLDAVSLIEQQLGNDPGLQQRGGISGAFNPLGLVSGALGTGEYENARGQARDVIARIRTGAALTNDEAKAFDRFLPQPGDSSSTVKQKLAFLRNQFQTVADRSNTGATLESAVMGASPQGQY